MTTTTTDQPFYSQQITLNVLRGWFGQWTGLYFLSACCMLVGVFLVSPDQHSKSWQAGENVLTGVLELYQVLLIAAAAALFRIKQTRPAATLGLLAAFFLLDTTYQMEVTATFEHGDRLVAILWLTMVALKLAGLCWAFQFKAAWFELVVPFAAAAAIAFVPQQLTRIQFNDPIVHLVAAWIGAGLAAVVLVTWPSRSATMAAGLRRSIKTAWIFWAVAYGYHLISWIRIFDITIFAPIVYLAPVFLLSALCAKRERRIWIACCVALSVSLFEPVLVAPAAAGATLVFIAQGIRLKRPTCWIGAVLACHGAVWTIGWHSGPLPAQNLYVMVATAAGLVALAMWYRMPGALVPLVIGLYPVAKHIDAFGTRGWGVTLIVGAFAALGLGFLINCFLSPVRDDEQK